MSIDSREIYLQRSLRRLDARLERLQQANRHFSLTRLGVFVAGGLLTAIAGMTWGESAALRLLTAASIAFIIVVYFHRRLDRRIQRFSIWRELRFRQSARLKLDWENLPPSLAEQHPNDRCPLDIDLDLTGPRSLHRLLDLAVSYAGSQRLAEWLCNAVPDRIEIERRQAIARELSGMPRFRDRLLLNLRLVSTTPLNGKHLLEWLQVEISLPGLKRRLAFASLHALITATLFILNALGLIPPLWLFSLALYMFHYLGVNLNRLLEAITRMDVELDVFHALLRHLQTSPLTGNPHLEQLCSPFRQPGDLPTDHLRRIKRITAGVGLRSNPAFGILLNLILPWDLLFATLAAREQQRLKHLLPEWLDTWYTLEALSALAGFAWLHPDYAWPEILPRIISTSPLAESTPSPANPAPPRPVPSPLLATQAMGHPLIPDERRVGNDFSIPTLGQVFLITGSNMAGKSTFIKTVGVNLCLAYAGGPVCAAALHTIPFQLHACIRITDSITDGFSYFYAEVRCLRALLDKLNTPGLPVLYLIDEIFRGTNNRERLIGSRAYIRSLAGANGCGLIATHDLELAGLADTNPAVHNYHFEDQVSEGRLVFDYHLRHGPSPTTNALKIMELEGLPVE